MSVRDRLLAYALALHKHQGLQEQVVLPGLALHVVDHIGELHVSIESKNRHRKDRKKTIRTTAFADVIPLSASRHLKTINSIQSQGLDTVANGNYIRMFGRLRCSFCTGPSCRKTVTSLIIFRCCFR